MTTLTPGFLHTRRTVRILSVALMVGALLPGCGAPAVNRQEPKTASDATDADRRAAVRMELASAYLGRGQYETALDELKQAQAIKPDVPGAVSLRALIYAAMGDYDAAEDGFKKGLASGRPDADLMHNYGWFLCQRQRYDEAARQFETALAVPQYRTPGRTLLAWGVCDARSGKLPAAQQHLLKAFEYEPGNPTVAVNLGEVLYRQADYERARFYARRVNNNPEQANASSLWLELRIERKAGNTANMEDLAKQMRSKYPQSPETQALNNGRFDE
ncbi:type IV pilus biogenesis/stability protein PilW [Roseateles depolymerans]|uniref:Type IV pilus biogenesis/stability protein PilW n=1 Tax=Roseateles depolymerans TaxID=76731 RepID=A0A0U3MVK7_9BURK|nr:type IV pilus biogenesis/stability protein PilW [Roseateles depolymerans]ALV05972.1 Type IV pilus biogenesis/stability protein PilW [Roseateles depolymerans]REG12052.1 type IV pilus assembly protein PilF [Roseateles depolymerans]